MGAAEQRQAERAGLNAAQLATATISRRYTGVRGQIRYRRDIIDERERRLEGAHLGLRAAVAAALQAANPPTDAEILEDSGWTAVQLAELRASHNIKRPE